MSTSIVVIVLAVALVAGDIATLVWFARKFGAFTPLKPGLETVEPAWIAYNVHSGPYQKIGPVCDAVFRALHETYGITTELGFGLYFDNPRKVAKEELRSLGGSILPPDRAEALSGKDLPFRLSSLPRSQAVVVRFPFRSRTSFMVGAMRAYPVLNRYLAEKGLPDGPVMEIYDMTANEIRYIRPLDIPTGDLERLLQE